MTDWQREARFRIALATQMHNNYRPTFRVPVPRRWWQFWKIGKWETFTGMSRADGERIQRMMANDR